MRGTLMRMTVVALGLWTLAALPARAQDPAAVNAKTIQVKLDNDRVRVLEYRSRPGFGVCGEGMHSHPDHVTVSLTGAKLKIKATDGSAVFRDIPPGTVFYAPAETHSAEVIGGLGTRSYIIELKGKDWKPSTG